MLKGADECKLLKPRFFVENKEPAILCLGAHSDDIEIGCGGTILRLLEDLPKAQIYWVVFSANEQRHIEALKGAENFLNTTKNKIIDVQNFRESYFPFIGDKIKDYFEKIKNNFSPDIIFTHYAHDAHQDHQFISNLSWNTFRDHLILEYEIPKYDGDLGNPNFYVNLSEKNTREKIDYICNTFQSQKKKQWFDEETFRSLLRIRGVECNSPSKYAEAFYCRKLVL